MDRSLHIDSQIAAQYATVEGTRVMFEEVRPRYLSISIQLRFRINTR